MLSSKFSQQFFLLSSKAIKWLILKPNLMGYKSEILVKYLWQYGTKVSEFMLNEYTALLRKMLVARILNDIAHSFCFIRKS